MQLSHATAFWLRLAGNILLDLFLYVHMFCSPFQGRAALTVEVTRPRGRPASRCCVGAFQNSQRLEMCGAPRSGQRGWSTCTPSRVHIPDVLSAIGKLDRRYSRSGSIGFNGVRADEEPRRELF